jgi:hypothetical protein
MRACDNPSFVNLGEGLECLARIAKPRLYCQPKTHVWSMGRQSSDQDALALRAALASDDGVAFASTGECVQRIIPRNLFRLQREPFEKTSGRVATKHERRLAIGFQSPMQRSFSTGSVRTLCPW